MDWSHVMLTIILPKWWMMSMDIIWIIYHTFPYLYFKIQIFLYNISWEIPHPLTMGPRFSLMLRCLYLNQMSYVYIRHTAYISSVIWRMVLYYLLIIDVLYFKALFNTTKNQWFLWVPARVQAVTSGFQWQPIFSTKTELKTTRCWAFEAFIEVHCGSECRQLLYSVFIESVVTSRMKSLQFLSVQRLG